MSPQIPVRRTRFVVEFPLDKRNGPGGATNTPGPGPQGGAPMDTARIHEDLRIEVPIEEELLAAVECALVWFEDRARHQDPDHAFGGEGRVEQKLRRAIAEVWIREEL